MKSQILLIALLAVMRATAYPHSIESRDMSVSDDEPLESDPMDQIAQESEDHETVLRAPRGNVKFIRTYKDSETSDELTEDEVAAKERKRALMVVLPYNTRNMSESKIQELYTKRPVTWIINSTSTQAPPPEIKTERTSTTVVVHPTSSTAWRPVSNGPTTPPPPVIRDDVRELLASIGLFPIEPSTTPKYETTTQPSEMDPEMKKLLGSLGLLSSDTNNEIPKPIAAQAYPAEIDPSSYTVFKPIPSGKQELKSDMKDFLSQFGLVDDKKSIHKFRNKKSHENVDIATPSPVSIPTLHPDNMSGEMKQVLHSLGLAPNVKPDEIKFKRSSIFNTPEPQVNEESVQEAQERSISATVFSPTTSIQNTLNNTDDVATLKTLLTTYRLLSRNASTPEELEQQLQTATKYLSEHDLSHLSKEKVETSSTLDKILDSPNPLSQEELLFALNAARNEVYKRQENTTTEKLNENQTEDSESIATTTEGKSEDSNASETQSSSTSEVTNTSSESDTTSNNSPSFEDLESSFGGSAAETVDESLPPPKPNGFYFLLDFNSFLNVGEEDKGVNLKFAPRAGNSRHFLPITVP